MSLLSIGSDAKTSKGEAQGVLTGVQYLAPGDTSGKEVCANRTEGCSDGCLYTAGRAATFKSINLARLRRTRELLADRTRYLANLTKEVAALGRRAHRTSMKAMVRLNGTSDLPWERLAPGLMAGFGSMQFYDYTKSARRMFAYLDGGMPQNYHLTFSRSEVNEADCLKVLARGGNVAVVFDTKKGQALPSHYMGARVIDGDVSDVRPRDPRGVVVGLRAKGRAKSDTTGFVVRLGGQA